MNKWYEQKNNNDTIVISTRVRLARNLSNMPFPERMNNEQRKLLIDKVRSALNGANFGQNISISEINMDNLSDIEALSMVERHIISPQFAQNRAFKALFLSSDDKISIMVNEEDHIRIQVLSAGSDLPLCLKLASDIDDLFDSCLDYAFSEDLGYLTQCPTNLGTGLRASVMVHLPTMENQNLISKLSSTISKLGMTIRGTFGEGSTAMGSMYQISNQVTLGISEQSAIDNLMGIVNQVVMQEERLRKSIFQENADVFEDKIYRAWGILSSARMMSAKEFVELSSLVRLGISLDILKDICLTELNALLFETGASNIMLKKGIELQPDQRDKIRAELIRTKLAHTVK